MAEPVTTFRKAHPDQKIVRLDINQASINMVADTLMDCAAQSQKGGLADAAAALRHVADRLRQAQ